MKNPTQIIAVAGLITSSKNEILLVRNPRRGWEIPGGQVEGGENLLHALKREVREEAGVEIEVGELGGIYTKASSPALLILGFICTYVGGGLTPSEESPEVAWISRSDVLDLVTHSAIHDRVGDLLEFNGRVKYRVYSTDPYVIYDEVYLG